MVCLACPNGTYQSFQGRDGCQSCQPGTANPYTGQRDCGECLAGTYSNVTAATTASLNAVTPTGATGCSYEFPGNKCPASEPAVRCSSNPDCRLAACPGGCTCHGVVATCHLGVCTAAGGTLCSSPVPPPPPTPWQKLPDAPVPGRQEVGATLADGGSALVYVGGFSYSAPYVLPSMESPVLTPTFPPLFGFVADLLFVRRQLPCPRPLGV